MWSIIINAEKIHFFITQEITNNFPHALVLTIGHFRPYLVPDMIYSFNDVIVFIKKNILIHLLICRCLVHLF
jgi:hypothetical protein